MKKFPTPLKTLKKSLGNVKEGLCVFCVAVCVRRGMVKTIPYKNRCATPCPQLWNEAGTSPLTPKHTFQEVLKGFGETFSKVSPKTHPRVPLRFADLFDLIAQEGGLFEFELLGGALHFGGELGDELFFFGLGQLAIGYAFFAAF